MLHSLNVTRRRELWVTFTYGPFKGEAKVYDSSDGPGPDYAGFGIRPGSRVSKLQLVYRGGVRPRGRPGPTAHSTRQPSRYRSPTRPATYRELRPVLARPSHPDSGPLRGA